ncbi:DUF3892 domain-containing protein [Stenotrophomonas sp. PFBMAA-4]|uniref:DUF3892 domain-containing protein n=1 Tax=Stenotrophomonas sp. PFBMAA-4 TaxID=3043301 RepID=UPI0024B57417|nr:DUF3892 domain-containing protein [Stenotrophomonas sp. PFBMAA-4]MDI9272446.1 DUF3892 domain-containing protein [Stenotrophomonas sp. PFBMAA-4]
MAKWADYGISAVRYNAAHTHIDRLRIHQDNGDSFGPAAEHERATIVRAIKDGVTFITIPRANGQWQKGQSVYIIKVNGVEYLKTVDNGQARDNLENLPEF